MASSLGARPKIVSPKAPTQGFDPLKLFAAFIPMGDAGIVHNIIPRGQVIITLVHFLYSV